MDHAFAGSVLLHSVPRGILRPCLSTIARELGYEPTAAWESQPRIVGSFRTEIQWVGSADTGAAVSAALAGWREIWFEVIQHAANGSSGSRWMYVPSLGIRHRHVDEFGNFVVGEQELLAAMQQANDGAFALRRELQNLLAHRWEIALEPLRVADAASDTEQKFRAS